MWEDPAARVRAGMRRRLRRIGLAGAAVVLAGAGVTFALIRTAPPETPLRPSAGGAVPWIDAPAEVGEMPSIPELNPSGVAACLAEDLRPLDMWSVSTDARPDITAIYVRVQNLGAEGCALSRRPTAQKITKEGNAIGPPIEPGVFPGTVEEGKATFGLRSGESAGAWLSFATSDCAGSVSPAAGVTVEANGMTIDVSQGKDLVPCPAMISAWTRDLAGPFSGLYVEVSGGSVKRGAEYVYFVDLLNATQADIPLQPCPVYVQQLIPHTEGVHAQSLTFTHRLNCDRAAIRPGEVVRYQMRMAIPDDLPTGEWTVSWNIAHGPSGHLPNTVRPF